MHTSACLRRPRGAWRAAARAARTRRRLGANLLELALPVADQAGRASTISAGLIERGRCSFSTHRCAIVCSVLPRPMSSARTPPAPCSRRCLQPRDASAGTARSSARKSPRMRWPLQRLRRAIRRARARAARRALRGPAVEPGHASNATSRCPSAAARTPGTRASLWTVRARVELCHHLHQRASDARAGPAGSAAVPGICTKRARRNRSGATRGRRRLPACRATPAIG